MDGKDSSLIMTFTRANPQAQNLSMNTDFMDSYFEYNGLMDSTNIINHLWVAI